MHRRNKRIKLLNRLLYSLVFIIVISISAFYLIRGKELSKTNEALENLKLKDTKSELLSGCFHQILKIENSFLQYSKDNESSNLLFYLEEVDSLQKQLNTLKKVFNTDFRKALLHQSNEENIQEEKDIVLKFKRIDQLIDSLALTSRSINHGSNNYSLVKSENFRVYSQSFLKEMIDSLTTTRNSQKDKNLPGISKIADNRNEQRRSEIDHVVTKNKVLNGKIKEILDFLAYKVQQNKKDEQVAALYEISKISKKTNQLIFISIGITLMLVLVIIMGFRQINYYEFIDKKKLISHLEESEEKYRNLIESATDSIFIIKDGIIVFVNQVLLKMSGYSEKELLGMPFMNFVSSKYRDQINEYYQKRLRGESVPFSYESIALRKDNTESPVEVTTSLFNFHGEKAELVFLRDISERKAAEIKILESRNSFENLFENSPISIWEEDISKVINEIDQLKQSGVDDFNIYFEQNPQQLIYFSTLIEILRINRETQLLYHANTKEELLSHIYESFEVFKYELISIAKGETKFEGQTTIRTIDGIILDVIIKMFTLRTNEKQIAYLTIVDISKLSAAEAEIRKFNSELEQRVLERTLQLEAVNKDLESFAYSISHDLRAPLRHIDGYTRMLKMSTPEQTKDTEHYFKKIAESSSKMSKMIDDLLNFSRLGRKNLVKTEIDLNIVIAKIIDQFKPDIETRSVEWKIDKLPTIKGDADLMHLAFVNLISNSLKFTSKKTKAIIEITNCSTVEKCCISVKDNGVGFDMKYSDKLFGVFQRLHTSDEFEGNGIGLANIQQIIHKHGGTISAIGEPNIGTTFFINL